MSSFAIAAARPVAGHRLPNRFGQDTGKSSALDRIKVRTGLWCSNEHHENKIFGLPAPPSGRIRKYSRRAVLCSGHINLGFPIRRRAGRR